YLIVLVIMILLFTSVSMDLSDFSLQNAMQSQTNELIRASNHTLTSSVDVIKYQGTGAIRSVSIRAPSDCSFTIGNKDVTAVCRNSSFSAGYDGTKFAVISPSTLVTYACPACVGGEIKSGETQLVQVKKS
ncbi:hypothetical protein H0N95_01150, partial [Candidatus Micrarchaeota archaeon]|nr:hypothetical protein [Candidatus Micrarchaeota archaeon]